MLVNKKNCLNFTRPLKLLIKSPKANTVTIVNLPKTPKINYSLFKERNRAPHSDSNFRTSAVSVPATNSPQPLPVTPLPPLVTEQAFELQSIVTTSPAELIPDYRIQVPNISEQDLQAVNQEVFKNPDFKDKQLSIIKAVLSNQNTMVCLPTGNGKSLIYQISGYVLGGVTIVIMPLISLINDQYEKLKSLNVPCCYFNETSTQSELCQLCHKIVIDKTIKFIFVTPERLLNSHHIQQLLKELHAADRLKLMVIDEFHCITHYSSEFRPAYKNLGQVIVDYPDVRVLCLSGSIHSCDLEKIKTNLGISNPVIFKDSPTRKNLYYEIIDKKRAYHEQIIQIINSKHTGQTGIIFCNKRKKCEDLCFKLSVAGISCQFFHSQMENTLKEQKRKNWQEGSVKVMIATSAFGMGIDNKQVRFIIHSDFPKSLTDYCQETGRAGRDGLRSDCYLLYSISDRRIPISYLYSAYTENNSSSFKDLYKMIDYCEEEAVCRKVQLALYFESEIDDACIDMCDNCLRKKQTIEFYQKDFSNEAGMIMRMIRNKSRWTFTRIVNVLIGQVASAEKNYRELDEFGSLKGLSCVPRILNKMLLNGVIEEYIQPNMTGNFNSYVRETRNQISNEQLRVLLTCEKLVLGNIVNQVMIVDSDIEIIDIPDSPLSCEFDSEVEIIDIECLPQKRQRDL